jgi:alpha-glucoside transport system permease protein
MDRVVQAVVVLVGVPVVLVGYILLTEWVLRFVPERRRPRVRPWFWVGPALAFLTIFLIYPSLNTFVLSFTNANGTEFVGLDNYVYSFTSSEMLTTIRNNVLWLIFFTLFTVVFGLLIAVLTDRVPYERVANAIIFLPMAISFVAAGVIWKFMYEYRPPGAPQTGTLNAVVTSAGGKPEAWLINQPWNNFFLIFVGVWMWTGFCMVILSAGLKGIPDDLIEAARVDGASEWRVFRSITVPLLAPTIAVVATTMVITALKAFDVVYVMTGGNFNTQVIAYQMYEELFSSRHVGRASAIAVVLLAAIIPIMLVNIRRFRQQEAIR